MNESTRRALRTAYQVVLGAVTVTPLLVTALSDTPLAAQIAAFGAAVVVASKVVNALEDAGLIPAWLKAAPESDF